MRFLKNVRIEGYVNKWYGNLDNKLWTRHCLGFIVEIVKAIVKKRRTLAFYTLHTIVYDKKGSFYWRLGPSKNGRSWQRMVEPKVPPRPRSPDLNPSELVIFLWGQLVYSQSINSVEELTGHVVGASAQIREDRKLF
jgi:hypothetical protein